MGSRRANKYASVVYIERAEEPTNLDRSYEDELITLHISYRQQRS